MGKSMVDEEVACRHEMIERKICRELAPDALRRTEPESVPVADVARSSKERVAAYSPPHQGPRSARNGHVNRRGSLQRRR